ncbi:hypothetical protein L596_013963 [Steinernema carpocapsae]|uniref:Uncharacterized protein n=1 Tax=Steinernema carpocapsae TaxID=34508 RepID=A0A4U5N9Y2_STECR|nr:hypothetical protein L596_013963 [Steinernema carpocapsae]
MDLIPGKIQVPFDEVCQFLLDSQRSLAKNGKHLIVKVTQQEHWGNSARSATFSCKRVSAKEWKKQVPNGGRQRRMSV